MLGVTLSNFPNSSDACSISIFSVFTRTYRGLETSTGKDKSTSILDQYKHFQLVETVKIHQKIFKKNKK